jgi:hypothetical protein
MRWSGQHTPYSCIGYSAAAGDMPESAKPVCNVYDDTLSANDDEKALTFLS